MEPTPERRVLPAAQEAVGGARIVVDAHARVSLQDAGEQHFYIAVVAVVVLGDRAFQPGVVLLARDLPRLLLAQGFVGLGHLPEPREDEAELDRHRLLAPERAVVVENRGSPRRPD